MLPEKLINRLFYRNNIGISKYGFLNQYNTALIKRYNVNVLINWHVFMTSDTYRTIIQKLNLSNYFYNSSYKSKFYNINYVIELEKKISPNFNYCLSYCLNSNKLWL